MLGELGKVKCRVYLSINRSAVQILEGAKNFSKFLDAYMGEDTMSRSNPLDVVVKEFFLGFCFVGHDEKRSKN